MIVFSNFCSDLRTFGCLIFNAIFRSSKTLKSMTLLEVRVLGLGRLLPEGKRGPYGTRGGVLEERMLALFLR